jgi:hypothetical protein
LIGPLPTFNKPIPEELDLSYNSLYGSIDQLANMTTANSIDLSHNYFSGPYACAPLAIDSPSMYSYPTALAGSSFNNLLSLNLAGNLLSGPIPSSINAPILTYFNLSDNDLSGDFPDFATIFYSLGLLVVYDDEVLPPPTDADSLSVTSRRTTSPTVTSLSL